MHYADANKFNFQAGQNKNMNQNGRAHFNFSPNQRGSCFSSFPPFKTHIPCDQFLISMFTLGMSIGKKHYALINEQEYLMQFK